MAESEKNIMNACIWKENWHDEKNNQSTNEIQKWNMEVDYTLPLHGWIDDEEVDVQMCLESILFYFYVRAECFKNIMDAHKSNEIWHDKKIY